MMLVHDDHTKVQYGKTARQYIKSPEGLAELNHFLFGILL